MILIIIITYRGIEVVNLSSSLIHHVGSALHPSPFPPIRPSTRPRNVFFLFCVGEPRGGSAHMLVVSSNEFDYCFLRAARHHQRHHQSSELHFADLQYCKLQYHLYSSRTASSVFLVFSSHSFWTSSSLDVPAGATQEEGHTGFFIHLPSAVRALIFLARSIQPFLSLVDRDVEFCVPTI